MSARPRSRLENQCVRNTSIAGITAASTTPSRKRSISSSGYEVTTPCSAAKTPHRISDQNISRLTLRRSAKSAAGTWKMK